jgi:uncharacterized protein (DUF2147 family)
LISCLTGGFVAAALVFAAGSALADPIGTWRDKDGTIIRIQKCGSGAALCGTITAMNPANDPETGNPWTDKYNPEQTKRGEPLIGLKVFIDMEPSGPNKWSGQLYNTDDGRSLRGNLLDRGPNILRVEGCVGTRCGGENLTRVKP